MGQHTKPASEFVDVQLVRQSLEAAAQLVARVAADDFIDEMWSRLENNNADDQFTEELQFDSPLEVAFWVWWMAMRKADGLCRLSLRLKRHVQVVCADHTYVVDFCVESIHQFPGFPLIGVELDGHAFHEKTKEQAEWRNARDRALQQQGWRIFHFSFSEFMRQPETCVTEVVEFARAALRRPPTNSK